MIWAWLLIVLLPSWAEATTYYVSAVATNGYIVGSDGNAGTAKGTAKLTVEGAYTAASNADTIMINDGTYIHATNFASGATKGLTILCETDYMCILRATSGNHVWDLALNSGVNYTFGKVVLDGNNAILRNTTISAAGAVSVTFNGTKFLNPTSTAVKDNKTGSTISMTDVVFSASALSNNNAIGALLDSGTHQTGNITIDGATIDAANTAVISRVLVSINRDSGTTPITATVSGLTGSFSSTQSNGIFGVLIENIDDALIEENTLTLSAVDVTGAQIRTTGAGLSAHRGLIRNNDFTMGASATAGYCAYSGVGTTGAGDNLTNDGIISGNTCTWLATPVAQTPHAYVCGIVTNCQIKGNTATNVYVGTLFARSTGGVSSGNLCLYCYGLIFYGKGASGSVIANNTAIQRNSIASTACLALNAHEDATNNANVAFRNNLCYSVGDAGARWTLAAASQTGTWDGNDYYTDQSLAANQFSYQGTPQSSVLAWNGIAQVGSDFNVNPQFINVGSLDLRLSGSSTIRRSGVATTCSDFRGRACYPDRPDIGAYQSSSGDPAATRAVRQ